MKKKSFANPESFRCWNSLVFLAAGMIVLMITFVVTTNIEKSHIQKNALDTVSFLQSTCQKYDDYQLGNITKDLQVLADKTMILAAYMENDEVNGAKEIRQFAERRYLTGVFLLDDALNLQYSINLDGEKTNSFLRKVLADNNAASIVQYPQKSYADQILVGDQYFNYVIASRRDRSGVIICYENITKLKEDKNELTLNSLLSEDSFRDNATIVITDGMQILATNEPSLQGLSVEECPISDMMFDEAQSSENASLATLQNGNDNWYGMHALYRDYFIYVFYSEQSVFAERFYVMLIALAVYLLFCLAGVILWQQYRREKLRKEAVIAEEASAAKTDFLRHMSHDILTPINGIRGLANMGKNSAESEMRRTEYFEKIMGNSDVLLDIARNVLDMSKLESGELSLEEGPCNLKEIFEDVTDSARRQAKEKNLVVSEKAEVTHWNVIGSTVHIRQILWNIVSNAVKYNKENGLVNIEWRESICDENYAVYEFVCEDTGAGISEEFKPHMYEMFSQEENEGRSSYRGTGLGLPIAKKLVELMNGTITFTSSKEKGTTFCVQLKLKIDTSHEEHLQADRNDDSLLKGCHVLLVEDNELNMEIAEYLLEEKDVIVTKAVNGLEALELFQTSEVGTFQMILMDIMMPVMDGWKASRQIRAQKREDALHIPIIAMSANSFDEDILQSKEAGINEHLAKPLQPEKLYAAMKKYLH